MYSSRISLSPYTRKTLQKMKYSHKDTGGRISLLQVFPSKNRWFFLEEYLVSNLFSRHYTPLFHFRQINPKLPHCNPKLVIKKNLFLSLPFQLPEQTQSTLHDAISLRGGPSDLAWEFDYKRWQYHINSVADACIAHCISEHHTYS